MSRNHKPRELSTERTRRKLQQVTERDGWACWICREPAFPHRMAGDKHPLRASLDHVVRLADGGSNDISNLRLAHARCNELRDRGLA